MIYINQEALVFIENEASKSKGIETGGILVGVVLKSNDILITHAFGPGPKARKTVTSFSKDYDYAKRMLYLYHQRYSVDFLGEWHKHPTNWVQYSSKDYESMNVTALSNKMPSYFIIVGDDFNQYNFYSHIKIYSLNKLNKKVNDYSFEIVYPPEQIAFEKGIEI